MSINFRWYDADNQIFIIQTVGVWTIQEYYDVYSAAVREMERIEHPIILINDMSKSGAPPRNFLSTARFSGNNKARNIDFTIMVGANMFVRRMVDIVGKIIPSFLSQQLRFVDTLDQAILIAEQAAAATYQPT